MLSYSDYDSEESKINAAREENTDLNQNVSSAGSESYDSEDENFDDDSDSSSSSSTETDSAFNQTLAPPTDYFFSMDSQHKDFVRSMAQFGDNILITASEDKTMKVFYF